MFNEELSPTGLEVVGFILVKVVRFKVYVTAIGQIVELNHLYTPDYGRVVKVEFGSELVYGRL